MGITVSIVGKWVSVDLPIFSYNFLENGVGFYSVSGAEKHFTYTDNGDSVTVHYTNDLLPSTFGYVIDGDLLLIEDSFGNRVKYKRHC